MEIIEYQTYREEEILPLYTSVGWTAYTDAPDVLRRGFAKSLLTLAAYEGKTLVGLVRAVGDGETVVLVQDLLVLPQHQRLGIGTALMRDALIRRTTGKTIYNEKETGVCLSLFVCITPYFPSSGSEKSVFKTPV